MIEQHEWHPGERVLLVGKRGFGRSRLFVREARVGKVYKTGNFTLVGHDGQYRPSGRKAGKLDGYSTPPHVEPWNDALWQKAQREAIEDQAASNLYKLSQQLDKLSRDLEESLKLWEELPYSLRELVQGTTE